MWSKMEIVVENANQQADKSNIIIKQQADQAE
jgi:hypothetical protein